MLALTMTTPAPPPASPLVSGSIRRLSPLGICYIETRDGEGYACKLSRVRGYRGQDPAAFGLVAGAAVRFSLSNPTTVETVELV